MNEAGPKSYIHPLSLATDCRWMSDVPPTKKRSAKDSGSAGNRTLVTWTPSKPCVLTIGPQNRVTAREFTQYVGYSV